MIECPRCHEEAGEWISCRNGMDGYVCLMCDHEWWKECTGSRVVYNAAKI